MRSSLEAAEKMPGDELLAELAARYIWWSAPEAASMRPARVIAQVMNIGIFEDAMRLLEQIGRTRLREVLYNAEPGWFNERSWHYWHYQLGMADSSADIPPLPQREF